MAWRRRLPLAVVAFLICTSCGDTRRGSDVRADDPLYPGPAGEVFRLLFTRTISFRVFDGTSERRVQRVQTGDLPAPPYADWEKPTFDDAELARIERLLDRTVAEDPLREAPALQRALFARDLWMAFDEMFGQGEAYERVQRSLARAIRELAPTRSELEGLPSTPSDTPLLSGLGDSDRGWAELKAEHHEVSEGVRLPTHAVAARGHSYFRMFLRFERGGARDHVERLARGETIDLPSGLDVALVEYANLIDRTLEVVPSSIVLKLQTRRIGDPSSEVGDVLEYRYRRQKIFAGWKDAGLARTDPDAEGHCSLSISNPVITGDTLESPLAAQCAQCHNPKGWTTDAEARSRRFGSIRSLVPAGGGGIGSRDAQIQASRRVLGLFGNLRRLGDYARR